MSSRIFVLGFLSILFGLAFFGYLDFRDHIFADPVRVSGKLTQASGKRTLASGKLTQTGTGAGSGLFFLVLDDRTQCFFRDSDLPTARRQMMKFGASSATTLVVSGTDAGTMPISGHRRLDHCRIVSWR